LHGLLTELRGSDLRFSTEEPGDFLERSAKRSLDAATIALIEEWVEGWVVRLLLAALSLQEGASPVAMQAAQAVRHLRGLMAFLAVDVLASQPEDVQRFPIRTSIVDSSSRSPTRTSGDQHWSDEPGDPRGRPRPCPYRREDRPFLAR
jgi:LuxR family maltose regulon positive regulatory protein